MKEFMAVTKALSDPGRVHILLSLDAGELCVCQITELFGLAPSTVSKHLALLHQAGACAFAEVGAVGLLPSARRQKFRARTERVALGESFLEGLR